MQTVDMLLLKRKTAEESLGATLLCDFKKSLRNINSRSH